MLACSGSHPAVDDGGGDGSTDASDGMVVDDGDVGVPPPICGDGCEIEQVVAGLAYTCVRFDDGRVACWGNLDPLDTLGLDVTSPVEVEGLPAVSELLGGYTHTCGMDTASELWCWGDATEQLFGTPTATPRDDWLSWRVIDVRAGGAHTCAVLLDGSVECWGTMNEGQLGDGTMEPHEEPAPVVGIDEVVELAAGAAFTCGRVDTGRLACWGDNGYGQIGDGTGGESLTDADRTEPQFMLSEVTHVTAGLRFACAQHNSGAVLCWGEDITGRAELLHGRRYLASPEPMDLPSGVAIADVQAAVGGLHACALAANGRVMCWGNNRQGQIGFGSSSTLAQAPVEAGEIDDATGIATGYGHTCAIRSRREVWCWGLNDNGQLGDGTRENRNLPVRVVGLD